MANIVNLNAICAITTFENLRMEGYMQTCVIFYRKLPNPEVYHTFSESRNIGLSKKYNESLSL